MQIAQGSVISKLFPDQQATMALVGFLADRENVNKIAKDSLLYGNDAVDRNMWAVEDSPNYKLNQAKQAAEFANYDAMIKLGPAVSEAADTFVNLAGQYPAPTVAISGATTALQGLAVAAGVFGFGWRSAGVGKMVGAAGAARPQAQRLQRRPRRTLARGCQRGIATAGALSGGLLVAAPLVSAYAYDQMTNTEGGLRARIADREARIKEFEEMIALKREAGDTPLSIGRMQAERDAVVASRDEMTRRLQELLANTKIGGEVNVNITAAPGIQANADLQPNDGTRMTGNVGRTNVNTD